MHLCIVCNEFPPVPHGGTGSSYHDLARGLVASGHRVTVVGCYSLTDRLLARAESPVENLRVVRLPLWPDWWPYRLRLRANRWRLRCWLAAAHRRNPFDVIESSDYGGWLPSGGPVGVPVVIRLRGSNLFFDRELGRPGDAAEHGLEIRTIRRAQHLAAVSYYAARCTQALTGESDRACTVIYNGVDAAWFAPAAGIPTEPGLIVFANTLNPKKGIEQLLDAMNLVCARHANARLVVIGQDTQKKLAGRSYVERLQERVQPEFRNRVTFTGRLDREGGLLDYLRRAHVCCYPSHMETFGIAAVEAMSVGKPVIYSRTGPGPEVVEDGVTGLLCDPHSATDIAAKLNTILENPTLAESLGRNARARVLEKFEKRAWVQRNLDYYKQLCAAPRPR